MEKKFYTVEGLYIAGGYELFASIEVLARNANEAHGLWVVQVIGRCNYRQKGALTVREGLHGADPMYRGRAMVAVDSGATAREALEG